MNNKILLLVFCATVALVRGERLVMHSLTGGEVFRLLREANRLDAIPMDHKITEGLAVLDERTTTSANDQLGKALSIFGGGSGGSGSYSELCFGTTQRRRIRIDRIGRQAKTTSAATPISTSGSSPGTGSTGAPSVATSTPSASSPSPSPTSSPTMTPTTPPTMTPTTTTPTYTPTYTTTYTPTYSPPSYPSPSPTTPPLPTAPMTPTSPSDGNVNCVSLVKPKK